MYVSLCLFVFVVSSTMMVFRVFSLLCALFVVFPPRVITLVSLVLVNLRCVLTAFAVCVPVTSFAPLTKHCHV